MTRDHHEKLDGVPAGLREQISYPARLCCVVDIYDALTTARPYRGPVPPAKVLGMMREEAERKIDPEIFLAWDGLVRSLLREDPSRSFGGRGGSATAVSAAPRAASSPSSLEERRSHPRHACRLLGQACFEHRGKPSGPEVGVWFPVGITDLSQGGLGLRFEFPPSRGDLIRVRIPQQGAGNALERAGEIVRVRQDPTGAWLVGIRFTNLVAGAAA